MEFTLSEIAEICKGTLSGDSKEVCSVVVDSRNWQIGEAPLFVAIRGENHDGHDYVRKMYERGVRAFMVEQEFDVETFPEAEFVIVESSLKGLQTLAREHRRHFKGKVAAITGSNGKTVVKEWIAQLAPEGFKIFRSPKSYNSQIGVALSLLMISGDEDLVLIEAGISEPGEMELLEHMIEPELGIFTMIGDAHQENFSSIEEKVTEKCKLFKNCKSVVYNSDYESVYKILNKSTRAKLVDNQKFISICNQEGRASCENAATVLAFYNLLGFDSAEIAQKLDTLVPIAMRLELREGINNSLIINDSYNSDINSLSIALDYLNNVAGDREQTLVLSDIEQSGLRERELYSEVARMIALSGVSYLICIGEALKRNAEFFECQKEFYPSTSAFLSVLNREHSANKAILLKGGRVWQFEKLSHALQLKTHTTVLEVDLDAMIHNLNYFRAKLGQECKIMAMIKAFGYGSGGYEIANMLQHQGVHYLAVAFADEGVALRERGITMPIVVLNADSDSFEQMIVNGLEPEIYSFGSLESFVDEVRRCGEREYPIHIKLDTGMHRLGFVEADIEQLNQLLKGYSDEIKVASIFSHFAASDEERHDGFTRVQIERFAEMSGAISLELESKPKPLWHMANSAAAERFAEARFDMFRLGIGLYGVSAMDEAKLHKVSSLRSRIVQIKEVPDNETVGYGRAGELRRNTKIATVPIGYADGLDRHLSNGLWSVMVNGKKAPIVGRVCMDTCMIDVTNIYVEAGDTVTIFGTEKGNTIEEMAAVLGTIPYEILTSISARVKRVYLKE